MSVSNAEASFFRVDRANIRYFVIVLLLMHLAFLFASLDPLVLIDIVVEICCPIEILCPLTIDNRSSGNRYFAVGNLYTRPIANGLRSIIFNRFGCYLIIRKNRFREYQ